MSAWGSSFGSCTGGTGGETIIVDLFEVELMASEIDVDVVDDALDVEILNTDIDVTIDNTAIDVEVE